MSTFDTVSIETMDNGYVLRYQSMFHNRDLVLSGLGATLERLVYEILRDEGTDIPKYVTSLKGDMLISNEQDASEPLKSLFTFAKTFFYKAVKKALEDNETALKEEQAQAEKPSE